MADAFGRVKRIVTPAQVGQFPAMIRSGRFLCALTALAACGPVSTYYQPGVTQDVLRADGLDCEVASLRAAPVANEIRQRPPVFVPPTQRCDATGCYVTPGYWVDGRIYTVDVNADLRARLTDQCMLERGYQPVRIPQCSANVAKAAPAPESQRLPQLTDNSCAIRHPDGSLQVVQTTG